MKTLSLSTLLLASAFAAPLTSAADDFPFSIATLRHGGPVCLEVRTNTGRELRLELGTFYTTHTFGKRLTEQQIASLDVLRLEAPEKFMLLQSMFPRHFAEYLLRTRLTPALVAAVEVRATGSVIPASTTPAMHSPDEVILAEQRGVFSSAEKNRVLTELERQYSPARTPRMSLVGEILAIDGKIVTESLRADAAAAGMSPEAFADARLREASEARKSLTGAGARAMLAFLQDPRLATFTKAEVRAAFQRVFGRDLAGVAEEAEREADRRERSGRFLQLTHVR